MNMTDYDRNINKMLPYMSRLLKSVVALGTLDAGLLDSDLDKEAFLKGEGFTCPFCESHRIEVVSVVDQVCRCKACAETDVFQSFYDNKKAR